MANTKRRRLARQKKAFYESLSHLSKSDHAFIVHRTQKGAGSTGKHHAKKGKGLCRHFREEATWRSGFKGEIPCTGMEAAPDYTERFRVRDGTRTISQRCWMRKRP